RPSFSYNPNAHGKHDMKSSSCVWPMLLVLVVVMCAGRSLAVEINVVALSGREGAYGPYDGPPSVYRRFDTPVVNNSERVAFGASLEVFASTTNNARVENGVWLALGSMNREVVRSGTEEPGGAFIFRQFGQVNLSDATSITFGATPASHSYQN